MAHQDLVSFHHDRVVTAMTSGLALGHLVARAAGRERAADVLPRAARRRVRRGRTAPARPRRRADRRTDVDAAPTAAQPRRGAHVNKRREAIAENPTQPASRPQRADSRRGGVFSAEQIRGARSDRGGGARPWVASRRRGGGPTARGGARRCSAERPTTRALGSRLAATGPSKPKHALGTGRNARRWSPHHDGAKRVTSVCVSLRRLMTRRMAATPHDQAHGCDAL